MRLKRIEVENYKSFYKRQAIEFESGFNLLVGTNNSGKTSVLELLALGPVQVPHRSLATIPNHGGSPAAATSQFEVGLWVGFEELQRLTGAPGGVMIPLGDSVAGRPGETRPQVLQEMLSRGRELAIQYGLGPEGGEYLGVSWPDKSAAGKIPLNQGSTYTSAMVDFTPAEPHIKSVQQLPVVSHWRQTLEGVKKRIYRFDAQRRPAGRSAPGESLVLDSLAQNLAACIAQMQLLDSHGHRHLCELIERVFPAIKWVQAPIKSSACELHCLPHPPEMRRDDLGLPLSVMGAGLGNVIAMIYVALTCREPQVIVIDEPNVYLHPRALRELMAILATEGRQHQYILTAHSSDMLTAVRPSTISLLAFDGTSTSVKHVGARNLHAIREQLSELGIRMTDLHAKDRVLWVEGQTEELVVPDILTWACPEIASGVAVLRVERTGTFNRRGVDHAEVADIYTRLSGSSALVPPMVCILLDAEKLGREARAKLTSASGGQLKFLDRRMLENYLLVPDAVAAVLSALEQRHVQPSEVQAMIDSELAGTSLADVDGAGILQRIFSDLSQTRHEFRKTRDVPELIDWLLENNPERLAPLGAFFRRLFELPVSQMNAQ